MVKLKHIDFQVPNWGEWASGPQNKLGYRSLVLADNPAGYWRLGEVNGTVAVDEMGANDLTYGSTMTLDHDGFIARDNDRSAHFAWNSDGSVGTASPTSVLAPQLDQALECWTNIDSFTAGHALWSYELDANNSYFAWVATSGRVAAHWRVGGTYYTSHSSLGAITAGQTHHIAASISSGGTVSVYIDGVADNAGTPGGLSPNATGKFWWGNRGAGLYMLGFMDEGAIYNRELAAEILGHYRTGIGKLVGP